MTGAIILLLVGMGFVLAEVFFPSLGAFGLIAATCVLIADILAFEEGNMVGWAFIGAEVILIPATIHLAFKALPHTRFGKTMMLTGPTVDHGPGTPTLSHLMGESGPALTDLRPSGTAQLGGERVSVVSQGGMIEKGTPVVVVSIQGTEIKVRPDERAAH